MLIVVISLLHSVYYKQMILIINKHFQTLLVWLSILFYTFMTGRNVNYVFFQHMLPWVQPLIPDFDPRQYSDTSNPHEFIYV